MAKRKRQAVAKIEKKTRPEKVEAPGPPATIPSVGTDQKPVMTAGLTVLANPSPKKPPMPDVVDDPGATFKMALFDAQMAALQNKRKYLELNYTMQMSNMQKKMQRELQDIDTELSTLQVRYKQQKDYVEQKHGIALRAYTYNDESGILTRRSLAGVEEKEKEDGRA